MKQLKQIKFYIGFSLLFSSFFQALVPLVVAAHDCNLFYQQEQIGSGNNQNFIIDNNLIECVTTMVHDAMQADIYDQLPESIKRCYRRIVNNEIGLLIEDVIQALPNILHYTFEQAYESIRMMRPNALDSKIVGDGIECDLIPVLTLLKLIKNRIGYVSDSACCDSVLGILGDACKKFGLSSNISCKIKEIIQEIIDTRIMLCNKFSQTFTILENITEEILENCVIDCEKFQQTWTILDQVSQKVIELNEELNECCEKIGADIFDTKTIICDKIELIEGCDFIILNSTPENKSNAHIVTDPITVPGIYCVGEDLNGTLDIQTSNVTIKFNGHTLHASSPGIESNGFDNIHIEDGTIAGTDPAISISTGIGIKITNMELTSNNIGIKFDTVQDFIIHGCQFRKNTGTAMDLSSSSNGKVTCCQMHENNGIESLIVINLSECKLLSFEDIIIIQNADIQALTGIRTINTHESNFNNIQISCNSATRVLQGIRLENSDDNTLKNCAISKNVVSSETITTFVGIDVTASTDGGSKNNSITDCQVHENESRSVGIETSSFFVGINIAGTVIGGNINQNSGSNTTIDSCLVQDNTCFGNGSSFFMGISLAGAIAGGMVDANACENCSITKCVVNNNKNESQGTNSRTFFTGINLATTQGAGTILEACKNCHISDCDVSSNTCTSDANGNLTFFIGTSLGGTVDGGGVGFNSCISCSGNDCTINNNTSCSGNSTSFFLGVNLGGSVHNGDIGQNSCSSCIVNCYTVNNNTCSGNSTSFFLGVNLGGTVEGGDVNDACSSCLVSNCSINNNSCSSNSVRVFFVGINLGGALDGNTVDVDTCASCSVNNCTVNKNICTSSTSFFVGINLGGTIRSGAVNANVCVNSFVRDCTVDGNKCNSSLDAFFVGINKGGAVNGGMIGDTVCANSIVSSVTVNKNTCNSSGSNFAAFFVGINLGGTMFGSGTVNSGICASCSLNDCSINRNICSGARSFLAGINFAGTVGNGTVNSNVCPSCSITDCFVNNNICNSGANSPAFFVGVNLAGKISGGTVQGNGCNDCKINTVYLLQNNITSGTSSGYLRGIYVNGQPGVFAGGCNDIIGISILVGGNTVEIQGEFTGIFIDGTGTGVRGCNNISLKMCEVRKNIGVGDSGGYKIAGADKDSENGGARNLQLEDCTAKQNTSSSNCSGFDIQETTNAIVLQCTSSTNTSEGFLVKDVINSCLRECKAIKNNKNGFIFDGTTLKSAITDSLAIVNTEDGFFFGSDTGQCYSSKNIAQRNGSNGFNNQGTNFFALNYAQFNTNINYVNIPNSVPLIGGSFPMNGNPFVNTFTL